MACGPWSPNENSSYRSPTSMVCTISPSFLRSFASDAVALGVVVGDDDKVCPVVGGVPAGRVVGDDRERRGSARAASASSVWVSPLGPGTVIEAS